MICPLMSRANLKRGTVCEVLCYKERCTLWVNDDCAYVQIARNRVLGETPQTKAVPGPMKKDDFIVKVLSRGSCIDSQAGDGAVYQIETYTLRLNHVALNAYLLSEMMNSRECYADGPEGRALLDDHIKEYADRRREWRYKIARQIGCNPDAGSFVATQLVAEFFGAIWMREIRVP